MKKVLVVLGTRPEAIKLWPVIEALKARDVPHEVLSTRQQRDLLEPLLEELQIVVDPEIGALPLEVWALWKDASLTARLGAYIEWLSVYMYAEHVGLVVVQGDTMTALAGALAAFYAGIPVAHVEAGLRTYDLTAPFPEEGNRQMISRIASLHFCPTDEAYDNLVRVEGHSIEERIYSVGNTVIDAVQRIGSGRPLNIKNGGILVTFHRREAWPEVAAVASAVRELAKKHYVTWVLHGNPALRAEILKHSAVYNASTDRCDNADGPCACGAWHKRGDGSGVIQFIEPLGYRAFIEQLLSAQLVLTDSGGVVEECTWLGRRCMILRNATERLEALDHGHHIHGLDELASLPRAIEDFLQEKGTVVPSKVYGDGHAARRIVDHILDFLRTSS